MTREQLKRHVEAAPPPGIEIPGYTNKVPTGLQKEKPSGSPRRGLYLCSPGF